MPRSRRVRTGWTVAAALALASAVSVSAQIGGRATRPQVVPPQGPVRQVIFKYCTNCHGIDDYAYNALDRAKWDALLTAERPDPQRLFAFTTRGTRRHADVTWRIGDWLVFGSESAGLATALRESFAPAQRVRLPMRAGQRSLNLSNAVAVAVFEAWRQCGWDGAA